MRSLTLLAVLALAGCADPVGDPPAGLVQGDCGGVYHGDLPRQILLDVGFRADVLRAKPDARLDDIDVAAEHDGDTYAESPVAQDGCVRFPMQDEGAYSFWAFGFADDGCWYSGHVRGLYDGSPLVEADIRLGRNCP